MFWMRSPMCLACLMVLLTTVAGRAEEKYAGIEVGAKGVKVVVLRPVAKGPPAVDHVATVNTTLAARLGVTGEFDPEALKDTAQEIGRLYGEVRSKHGVPAERIALAASSGLFAAVEKQPEKLKANQAALAAAVRQAVGRELTFLTARREAELSVLSILPDAQRETGLVVDVGSGNTKGGFFDEGKVVTFGLAVGSVSLRDRIQAKGQAFAPAAAEFGREKLRPALREELAKHPSFRQRRHIYLAGGAAWAFATLTRPANRAAYVEMAGADFRRYQDSLASDAARALAPDLSRVSDPKAQAEATDDLRRVRDTFTVENLLAGAAILAAVGEELDGEGKRFYFARHAHLGWITAHAAEQVGRR